MQTWLNWFGLISGILGILTFSVGCLAYYKSSVEKGYASQRDWGHVKNNQLQIVENLKVIDEELDSRFDAMNIQIVEIKAILYVAILGKKPEL